MALKGISHDDALHDGLLSTGLIIAVMGVVYWDLKIAPISRLKLPAAIPTQLVIFGKSASIASSPSPAVDTEPHCPALQGSQKTWGSRVSEALRSDATGQKDLLAACDKENIRNSTDCQSSVIRDRVVLLVDDIVDSRWTHGCGC